MTKEKNDQALQRAKENENRLMAQRQSMLNLKIMKDKEKSN